MNFARCFTVKKIERIIDVNPLNVELDDKLTKSAGDSSGTIRIALPREDAVLLLTEEDPGHFKGSHNDYDLDVTFPHSVMEIAIARNGKEGPIEQVGTVTAVDG